MKFKLSNEVQPSQEIIGTIISAVFWAPFLIIFGAIALGALKEFIKRMIFGKKTIPEKLVEASEEINFECLGYDDELIINGNDYPRADLTDAKDGKHWEIDHEAVKTITADSREYDDEDYDCADKFRIYHISDVVSTIKKIDAFVAFLLSISNLKGCSKTIDAYLKGHFTKDELIVENNNRWSKYVFKNKLPVKVQWPNAEQFKQPVASVNKIKTAGKSLVTHCAALAKKFDSVIPKEEEVDNLKDKSAAQDIAVYVKSCDEIVMYLGVIANMLDFFCFPTLDNDEIYGSGLRLVDKNGKDITDYH